MVVIKSDCRKNALVGCWIKGGVFSEWLHPTFIISAQQRKDAGLCHSAISAFVGNVCHISPQDFAAIMSHVDKRHAGRAKSWHWP